MKYLLLHSGGRGVRGRRLFLSPKHFEHFLGLLVKYSRELAVKVIAYCLMTNHYHLLLLVPEDVRTKFFKKLNTGYAMFFNRSVDHPGHVFDPRCWWFDRSGNDRVATVGRYIPLNPVVAGIADLPHLYAHSSYRFSIGMAPKPEWLDDEPLLSLFSTNPETARRKYQQWVESAVDMRKSAHSLARRVANLSRSGVRAPHILEQVEFLSFAVAGLARECPEALAEGLGEVELLLYCLDRLGGPPQSILADMYGVPRTTMRDRLRRAREKIESDPNLFSQLDLIVNRGLVA